jgi:hypothetical protein
MVYLRVLPLEGTCVKKWCGQGIRKRSVSWNLPKLSRLWRCNGGFGPHRTTYGQNDTCVVQHIPAEGLPVCGETNRLAGAIGQDCGAHARNICQESKQVDKSREPGTADVSVKCLAHSTQTSQSQSQEDSKDFIFQQDGAPPHFHLDICAYLNANLPGRWIGRTSNNDSAFLPWPPQSPDLTPYDFFFMGLCQGSCVCAPYATRFTTAPTKNRGGSRYCRPWDVATCVAGTVLQDWRLPRHQGWIYGAPVK